MDIYSSSQNCVKLITYFLNSRDLYRRITSNKAVVVEQFAAVFAFDRAKVAFSLPAHVWRTSSSQLTCTSVHTYMSVALFYCFRVHWRPRAFYEMNNLFHAGFILEWLLCFLVTRLWGNDFVNGFIPKFIFGLAICATYKNDDFIVYLIINFNH